MENSKLGTIETIALIIIVTINHIILNLPENIINSTGSASSLNVLYISIIIFIICALIIKLFKNFPNSDIFDISNFLGGPKLRTIMSSLYCIFLIFVTSTLVRYFSESLRLIYLPNSNIEIILLVFIIVGCIANKFGFSSIAKCNLIILPIILISTIVVFLSSSNNFVPERIYPLLGYGVKETFLDGLQNLYAFGGIAILFLIPPMLKEKKDFKKITYISVGVSCFLLFLAVTSLLLLFSFTTSSQNLLSIYLVTRVIEFGRFLQRIDVLFMLLWILALFSYISVIMGCTLFSFKKATKTKYSNGMVYALGALIFGFSLVGQNIYHAKFLDMVVYKYIVLGLIFGVNFIVLILANIKYRKQHKNKQIGGIENVQTT